MAGAPIDVYLEEGPRRVFAGAIDWPGWCRSGRDAEWALEALLAYAPRYAEALRGARLGFRAPARAGALHVRERLPGTATTDFGAPDVAPAADSGPFDAAVAARMARILRACWSAFDRAAAGARGLELRRGPRGGGRDLDAIVAHVLGATAGYLRRIAGTPPRIDPGNAAASTDELRRSVEEALSRAAAEGVPETRPRGGRMLRPRYFVRREAWHVLDHAWEIQDRAAP